MTCIDSKLFQQGAQVLQASGSLFVFLLLPSYSPADVTLAIEALREANDAGADPAFRWRVYSETGQPMTSDSRLTLGVDGGLEEVGTDATIIVCGGNRMGERPSDTLLSYLRKSYRHGTKLGSFGNGCEVLAQAGLLPKGQVAAHWAFSTAMQETYLDLDVRRQLFARTDKVMTCAGGLASVDMFLALIAESQGIDCAQKAAAALVCSNIRDPQNEQTLSLSCQLGSQNEFLIAAITLMKETLENPLSTAEVARSIGVSCRQLERLFTKYTGTTPKAYNDKLRLENARQLLQQTEMTPMEIALACGFSSTETFAKLYCKRFGVRPNADRGVSPAVWAKVS
ncbi:MAG: GlxA family transcriptional regulator [Pelagimonas sp.]|jgi:transcriptional regulator GlxA family with amidase domain|nr:GlxA family transcriptional regulator [Pelagimonas sp.]